MERYLDPAPAIKPRLITLGILLLPVLLSWKIGVVWQLAACFMPVMLTGTYRVSKVRGDRFDMQMHFGFIPLKKVKCLLPSVVVIHTKFQQSGHWGTLMLFGPVQWIFGFIFDFLIPAIGGPFEIWLETAKGREILAWNGYNQKHFEKNLAFLQTRTGAEVRVR